MGNNIKKDKTLFDEFLDVLGSDKMQELLKQGLAHVKKTTTDNPYYFKNPPNYEHTLYEWAKRDSWTLLESINIITHCHPLRPKSVSEHAELNKEIRINEDLVVRSIGVSLFPVNGNEPSENYRFQPEDIIQWAMEKALTIPPVLFEIFKSEKNGDSIHPNTVKNLAKREEIYAAAFVLLSEFRDQCVAKSSGKVKLTALLDLMDQRANDFWPEEGKPPLERSTIEKYLSQWLKKVKISKK